MDYFIENKEVVDFVPLHIARQAIHDKNLPWLTETIDYIKRIWRVTRREPTSTEIETMLISSDFIATYPEHIDIAINIDKHTISAINQNKELLLKAVESANKHINMIDDHNRRETLLNDIEYKIKFKQRRKGIDSIQSITR